MTPLTFSNPLKFGTDSTIMPKVDLPSSTERERALETSRETRTWSLRGVLQRGPARVGAVATADGRMKARRQRFFPSRSRPGIDRGQDRKCQIVTSLNSFVVCFSLVSMADVQKIRNAQRACGPATILAIGTANPPNCAYQDDFPDYYFSITESQRKTELKEKFKRICMYSHELLFYLMTIILPHLWVIFFFIFKESFNLWYSLLIILFIIRPRH